MVFRRDGLHGGVLSYRYFWTWELLRRDVGKCRPKVGRLGTCKWIISEDGSSLQTGSILRFQNLSFLGWNCIVTRISVHRPWDKRVKLTFFMDGGIGLCFPQGASGDRDLSNCYTPLLKQKLPRKNVNFHLQAGTSLVFKGGVGTRMTTSGFEVEQQKSKGLEPRSDEGMSLVAILISTMSTWHIFHRIFGTPVMGFFIFLC